MTETSDIEAVDTHDIEAINEALALIDQGLGTLGARELVSSTEITDLLLDVRTLLSRPSEELVSPN